MLNNSQDRMHAKEHDCTFKNPADSPLSDIHYVYTFFKNDQDIRLF